MNIHSATASARISDAGFRPDLEGLRGLAIILVLAFHAGIAGVAGGFIGVDVFFVLSGFLITGLLLREHERKGRISLSAFYVRRARRILPAALVVIVFTLAAAALLAAPLNLPRFADDAVASALSLGNMRFAAQGLDYFAASASPSPFLHYWSLGVEEQFYLVWPALLILAIRGRRPRLSVGLAIGLVLVISLAASIFLTDAAAPWAFYSLPARAWQLAAGGLLAFLPLAAAGRRIGWLLAGLGWLGLVAIIAAAVWLINGSTPYPGLAALLPTAGSAALIASGLRPGSPGAILAIAPLRFLGRISFSLYLVHWPILLLPAAALPLGVELPLAERLGLVGVSIAVAYVSWRFVEDPFHHSRRFTFSVPRVLGLAGASVALTIAVAVAVSLSAVASLDAPGVASVGGPALGTSPDGGGAIVGGDVGVEDTPPPGVVVIDPDETPTPDVTSTPDVTPSPGSTPTPGTTSTPGTTPTPGSTPTPDVTSSPTPKPTPTPVPPPSVNTGPLPADITPRLSDAASDWEQPFHDGCELQYNGTAPLSGCVYGDPNGDKTVVLVGDSHAGQWFPALNIIAHQEHWRFIPLLKFSCRLFDVPQYSRVLQREYTECEAWLNNAMAKLRALKPDLTIVAGARDPGMMNSADNDPTRQGQSTARMLAGVTGQVAIMVETPWSIFDVPTCLSLHKSNVGACATDRATALGWRYLLAERAAAKALGARATIVNMTDYLCPGKICSAVLDDHIVMRDSDHLTAAIVSDLAPALKAKLPDLGP